MWYAIALRTSPRRRQRLAAALAPSATHHRFADHGPESFLPLRNFSQLFSKPAYGQPRIKSAKFSSVFSNIMLRVHILRPRRTQRERASHQFVLGNQRDALVLTRRVGNSRAISMTFDGIQIIGNRAVGEYALKAAESERKRSHLMLHSGHDDQVQRLLIVMQPGTYVRPHRHSQQWEMLILLRGKGELLHFGSDGQLLSRVEMSSEAPIAQIPIEAWHGFVVLEPDTVVYGGEAWPVSGERICRLGTG